MRYTAHQKYCLHLFLKTKRAGNFHFCPTKSVEKNNSQPQFVNPETLHQPENLDLRNLMCVLTISLSYLLLTKFIFPIVYLNLYPSHRETHRDHQTQRPTDGDRNPTHIHSRRHIQRRTKMHITKPCKKTHVQTHHYTDTAYLYTGTPRHRYRYNSTNTSTSINSWTSHP